MKLTMHDKIVTSYGDQPADEAVDAGMPASEANALASVSSMADYEHDLLQPPQADLAPGLRTMKCGLSARSA